MIISNSCRDCTKASSCQKARNFENYRGDSGCMDFHGSFEVSENEICVINYDDTDGESAQDDYDPYTGKYAFVSPDDGIEECIHTPEKAGEAMKHISELMDKHRAEQPELYGHSMTDEEFTKAYKNYMDEYRTDDDDVSDEEYEAAAQEAHDELVRSLVEAGGEIRELTDEKKRLIYSLKETLKWLNYFLTHNRDDVYYDEAHEARWRAEYLLMDLEGTE